MRAEALRATSSSVRWLRRGILAALVLAVALFAADLRVAGLLGYPGEWRDAALSIGMVLVGILLVGVLCEAILRLPWRGVKPFLYAATVIPALGGLAAIALPEGVLHLLTLDNSIGYSSSGRGLRLISILMVPLAGAVAMIVAVSFDSRWSRVLPTVALALLLTVAARELAVQSFHGMWCVEAWEFDGDIRQFPACTGILDEGSVNPVEPVP